MFSTQSTASQPSIKITRARTVLLIGYAFALVCALYWPMLYAKWSVYSDHEMQVYLGHEGVVHLSDIPKLLLGTEVGYPGQVSRYRPTTYLMYIFEAFLWGKNPTLWQFGRLAMLAISLAGITVAFGRFFRWPLAIALSTLLMTAPYWPTIWIGTGPNEQYIALYLVGFCWSYALLHGWPMSVAGDNRHRPLAWICCALSVMLLVGCKELMFMIMLPWAWLGLVTWRRDRRLSYRWIVLLIPFLWSAFILIAIVVGVRANGADFYGNSISFSDRFRNLVETFGHSPLRWMTAILISLVALYLFARRYPASRLVWIRSEWLSVAIVTQSALLLFGLGHAFFYDSWPTLSRYAFPGELLAFVSYLLVLYLCLEAIAAVLPRARAASELAVAVVVAASVVHIGFAPIRSTAAGYVEGSRNFTDSIESVLALSRQFPDVPIVVESATPYDLEPVFAVNRFLKLHGLAAPIFLRLHDLANADFPKQPFFYSMIGTLEQLSSTGKINVLGTAGTLPSPFLADYTPLTQLSRGRCFSILLAKAPKTDCEVIASIKY